MHSFHENQKTWQNVHSKNFRPQEADKRKMAMLCQRQSSSGLLTFLQFENPQKMNDLLATFLMHISNVRLKLVKN